VCDQANDAIIDSTSAALGSDGIPAHSFDVVSSDLSSSPADNSTDNNSGTETNSNQRFKEDPAPRLKNNEFVEHGRWLCIWPGCDRSFEENRKRK
jgi:hypothetical protein